MTAQEGILFIATGEQHVHEAIENARASAEHACGRRLVLITDRVHEVSDADVFDQVLAHPDPVGGYRDKIGPLQRLPFQRTLFLDSDARLTAPVDALFAALGPADLAAVHAPVRHPPGWSDKRVPALFPELNSGVLLFRRGPLQRRLVRRWLRLYDRLHHRFGQTWDQASLRSVVWRLMQRRGLRLAVLPAEANFRTTKPWVAGQGLPVHVLHGRVPSDEQSLLQAYLNDNVERFRTWAEWFDLHPESQLRLRIGKPAPEPPRL